MLIYEVSLTVDLSHVVDRFDVLRAQPGEEMSELPFVKRNRVWPQIPAPTINKRGGQMV